MEKINNYTPGPWYVFPQWPDRFTIGAYRRGSLCITVAKAEPKEIITASGDDSILEEEATANAKLIALAPTLYEQHFKMLEALKAIMNEYDSKGQLLGFDVNIVRQTIKDCEL